MKKNSFVMTSVMVRKNAYSAKDLTIELHKLIQTIKTSQISVVNPGWGDPSELFIETDDGQTWVMGFYVESRGMRNEP